MACMVPRRIWRTNRLAKLLFPNRHAGLAGVHQARSPLDRGGVHVSARFAITT